MAFTRFMLLVALFILWMGIISIRLVHLQVSQREWLRAAALNQRRDQTRKKLLRGTILDRDGHYLAISIKTKSLVADPSRIEDADKIANEVAGVLEVKSDEILKLLREGKENNKKFVWLARKLDEDTSQKIDDFHEPGLYWIEEEKRMYPYNTLAAQVIGFSNFENIGSAGIEQSQDTLLYGALVKGWRDRDRLGRVYDREEVKLDPPKDIILTIRASIQYKAEQALKEGIKNTGAKSGTAIVLDPHTGEILAMASYPSYDPNSFNEAEPEFFKNNAFQNVYSPGSVFSTIVFGGALEEKLIAPDGQIDVKDSIKVGGREFKDSRPAKMMTYTEALAASSNFATIKTALDLGKDKFYNYAYKLGFGRVTGIELPGEQSGILRLPEMWNNDSLASIAIGYEISTTALQITSAYGTIANDGVRTKPHIIKEIRNSDGETVSNEKTEKTRVFSSETARALREMLRQVVVQGTGKKAQLNEYSSGGKTGTAWKFDPILKQYNPAKFIASFVGFAPADNPSIVITVVIDEPRGGQYSGGEVAGPIFKDIAEQILPELNALPDINN